MVRIELALRFDPFSVTQTPSTPEWYFDPTELRVLALENRGEINYMHLVI
jgi:hypothetical protein